MVEITGSGVEVWREQLNALQGLECGTWPFTAVVPRKFRSRAGDVGQGLWGEGGRWASIKEWANWSYFEAGTRNRIHSMRTGTEVRGWRPSPADGVGSDSAEATSGRQAQWRDLGAADLGKRHGSSTSRVGRQWGDSWREVAGLGGGADLVLG